MAIFQSIYRKPPIHFIRFFMQKYTFSWELKEGDWVNNDFLFQISHLKKTFLEILSHIFKTLILKTLQNEEKFCFKMEAGATADVTCAAMPSTSTTTTPIPSKSFKLIHSL